MYIDKRNHFGFADSTTSLTCKPKTSRQQFGQLARMMPLWKRIVQWLIEDC